LKGRTNLPWDEDSWAILATEAYDSLGLLYRIQLAFQSPCYDAPAANADTSVIYDMMTGVYSFNFYYGGSQGGGYRKFIEPLPPKMWAPASIAGEGVR
jgi:hypothetical protein